MKTRFLHIVGLLLLSWVAPCSWAQSSARPAHLTAIRKVQPSTMVPQEEKEDASLEQLGIKAADRKNLQRVGISVKDGDTLYLAFLKDIYIFPPYRFTSKKQERFYWRTVRDVKKTLPYAKIIAKEMQRTDSLMLKMTPREQRRFWKQYEKILFQQYEMDLRSWTASQGQMLMKLVDRETGHTSYEVIKMYRGSFSANFWQMVAKTVGNDLKEGYDGDDKDKIVERVITLVEAGQL